MPIGTGHVRAAIASPRNRIAYLVAALCAWAMMCALPVRAQSTAAPPAPAAGLGEWHPMGNGGEMMRLVGDPGKPEWFAFRVRYPAGMKTDSAPHFHWGRST